MHDKTTDINFIYKGIMTLFRQVTKWLLDSSWTNLSLPGCFPKAMAVANANFFT